MKIDVKTAMSESGINCEIRGLPGKAVLLSDDLIARYALAVDDPKSPPVKPGLILVSHKNENGKAVGEILRPQAENDLVLMLRVDGEDTRVRFGTSLEVLQATRRVQDIREKAAESETPLPARTEAALAGIEASAESIFRSISAQGSFATPENATAARSFALEKARRARFNGLTEMQMDRITEMQALRRTIGRVLPDHPLALAGEGAHETEHKARDVMAKLGVRTTTLEQMLPPGMSQMMLAAGAIQKMGGGRDPRMAAMMQSAKAMADLSTRVFGAITTTAPEKLDIAPLQPRQFEKITQDLGRFEVTGDWDEEIRERLQDIFRENGIGDYEHRVAVFNTGGADVMLVQNKVGTMTNAYLYGWDSDSRRAQVPDRDVLLYTEADVPTEEALEEARAAVRDLRYENGAEIDFAMDAFEEAGEFGVDDADLDEFEDAMDDDPEYDIEDEDLDPNDWRY